MKLKVGATIKQEGYYHVPLEKQIEMAKHSMALQIVEKIIEEGLAPVRITDVNGDYIELIMSVEVRNEG